MKRPLHFLPLVLLLAACGGSDGGSSSSAPNAFLGDYRGSYSAPFLDDTGTYTVSVARSGRVTGSGVSNGGGEGTISGTFNSRGFFSGRISFANNTSGTLKGTLTKQADGSLTGTLNEVYGDASGDVRVDLAPLQTVD